MKYGTVDLNTGKLISISSQLPILNEELYYSVELEDDFGVNTTWDSETRTVIPWSKKIRVITRLQFLLRLTPSEYSSIVAASSNVGEIAYYLELIRLSEEINLDDPVTVSGVNFMEQAGLIGEGRAAQILE